uniref:Cytochrome P450 CYP71DAR1 n=1 Tax=Valeriana officinalis TaxID=19953 RepID=A0A4Y5R520_VALOF|nr:cytochrome P450 CYP71DAR1 [Valeriana officinalis]
MKMEFDLRSISFIISFFIFLLILTKILKKPNSTLKLPPGPPQLPIIGNLHNLLGSSLTHQTLKHLSDKYGPLMYLKLGEHSAVVVSSPELATQIMKTHDVIFAQRPITLVSTIVWYNSTGIAFSPNNDYWRQLRKICVMELMSLKRVQSFRSIREEEVWNLVTDLKSNVNSVINLSKKIFSLTYAITGRAALGQKNSDQELVIKLVEDITKFAAGFSVAELYPSVRILQVMSGERSKLEKIHERMDTVLERILHQHKQENPRKTGEEDLVDVLLRIQKNGELEFPLTDDNVKAVIWDIFTAGSETSSTTVEWAMSEMLRNPRIMEIAQTEVWRVFGPKGNVDETGLNELKYLKAVIKETLRLHPSAPLLLPRESNQACEINGYTIPVKTKVMVNAWAIGRDPRFWTEPERFDPERFLDSEIDFKGTDYEYTPFGAGRRICPGILFALPNIELPLAHLLYHFDWKLGANLKFEDLDMTESFGLTVRRKNDLYLIHVPHYI